MKPMLSSEFLEQVRAGRKEFRDSELNYADLSNHVFDGLVFKNCKFYFVTMRHCTLRNLRFENCEFFFAAFGWSTFENCQFVKCRMDYSGGTEARFVDTVMTETSLSWLSLISADTSGLRLERCTEFKVIRHLSEITQQDIAAGLAGLEPVIQQLDFGMQQQVRQLLIDVAKRYQLDLRQPAQKNTQPYSGHAGGDGAYKMFDALVDRAIGLYGTSGTYKTKRPYDTQQGKYKQ